jgi:hypothetical protein
MSNNIRHVSKENHARDFLIRVIHKNSHLSYIININAEAQKHLCPKKKKELKISESIISSETPENVTNHLEFTCQGSIDIAGIFLEFSDMINHQTSKSCAVSCPDAAPRCS